MQLTNRLCRTGFWPQPMSVPLPHSQAYIWMCRVWHHLSVALTPPTSTTSPAAHPSVVPSLASIMQLLNQLTLRQAIISHQTHNQRSPHVQATSWTHSNIKGHRVCPHSTAVVLQKHSPVRTTWTQNTKYKRTTNFSKELKEFKKDSKVSSTTYTG